MRVNDRNIGNRWKDLLGKNAIKKSNFEKFLERNPMNLEHLSNAIVIQELSSDVEQGYINGAALTVLRANVLTGSHPEHIARNDTQHVYNQIMSVTKDDMPASPDLVRILIETISQKKGGISMSMVWQHIGVNQNRGRDMLSRSHYALDWPIWFTLREYAFNQD